MVFLGRKEKREHERRLLASTDAVGQQQQQQQQNVNKVAHYDNGTIGLYCTLYRKADMVPILLALGNVLLAARGNFFFFAWVMVEEVFMSIKWFFCVALCWR